MQTKGIKNFVIGVKWDTKSFESGFKRVNSGITTFKTSVTAMSAAVKQGSSKLVSSITSGLTSAVASTAAIASGLSGIIASTALVSKKIQETGLKADWLGILPSELYAGSTAFRHVGASADEFYGVMFKLTDALDKFKILGETGFIEAGILKGLSVDTFRNSANASELFLNVLKEFPKLDLRRQRMIAQDLGLSPETLSLFRQGEESYSKLFSFYKGLRPVFDEASAASRVFNAEITTLSQNFASIADIFSVKILGTMNKYLKLTNEVIDKNRELINSFAESVAESPGAAILGVSAGGAVAGSVLSGVGTKTGLGVLKTVGLAASRASVAGALVGGAQLSTELLSNVGSNEIKNLTGLSIPQNFTPQGVINTLNEWEANVLTPKLMSMWGSIKNFVSPSTSDKIKVDITLKTDDLVLIDKVNTEMNNQYDISVDYFESSEAR